MGYAIAFISVDGRECDTPKEWSSTIAFVMLGECDTPKESLRERICDVGELRYSEGVVFDHRICDVGKVRYSEGVTS
jgi:hypothetical protein